VAYPVGVQRDIRFRPGDLVTHRLYGYRGVVADRDDSCRADEAWYLSNPTQPAREQPWFHVLVHGSDATTYVAQENLRLYRGGEQVANPLVRRYFAAFSQGRYRLPAEVGGTSGAAARDRDDATS